MILLRSLIKPLAINSTLILEKIAFFHLSKVTSGIDSAIFAETEIQGQVKRAYEEAQLKGKCNKELHFLFQKSLKIGKEMRSSLQIEEDAPNLTSEVKNLLLDQIEGKKVLFVGASLTNHKIIRELSGQGFEIHLTNRSEEKGRRLADTLKVDYLHWDSLNHWDQFDGVVLATSSPHYLLSSKEVSGPKLILDLSVPRDVDPKLGLQNGVRLFNIDQINKRVRKKRKLFLPHKSVLAQKIYSKVSLQHQIFKSKSARVGSLQAI